MRKFSDCKVHSKRGPTKSPVQRPNSQSIETSIIGTCVQLSNVFAFTLSRVDAFFALPILIQCGFAHAHLAVVDRERY
eukprot:2853845-Rhodomonas_salina.4